MHKNSSFLRPMIFIIGLFLLVPIVSAESFAPIEVGTTFVPVGATNIQNPYINMYVVTPVRNGVYEGVLRETKKVDIGLQTAQFAVAPGQLVEFLTFSDYTKAKYTTRWTFTSPPYKNFSKEDGVFARLCQINFLDTTTKLKTNDGFDSCSVSFGYAIADDFVVIAAKSLQNGTYEHPGYADFEVWVQQTNEPTTGIPGASVALIEPGTKQVIAKGITDHRGAVTFILERERKFYFEAVAKNAYYGGYQPAYVSTPRVFYISGNGKTIVNSFDNQSTYVFRLGAYPNTQPPATTPTPVPVSVQLAAPTVLYPKENEVLTNYPRVAKFEWKGVTGAAQYEIAIECDICGETRWSSKYPLYLSSHTAFKTIPLAGDNQFRFRVSALAGDGTRSPWSDYRYFWYKTAPTPSSTPGPMPTSPPAPPDEGDDSDFDEYGNDADLVLHEATVKYGKRQRDSVRGLQARFVVENTSEDIQRFVFDVNCELLQPSGNQNIVKWTKNYDIKPGKRTFSFFNQLNSETADLLESFSKTRGFGDEVIACGLQITGLYNFSTGSVQPDAREDNNKIALGLHWKYRKLRINSMTRQF